jgi:hypothetical protein
VSSRVNEAYNSLSQPLRRAEYILEQNGMPIAEGDQLDDMEFISEIMQVRESIDDAEDIQELSHVVDDNAGASLAHCACSRNIESGNSQDCRNGVRAGASCGCGGMGAGQGGCCATQVPGRDWTGRQAEDGEYIKY